MKGLKITLCTFLIGILTTTSLKAQDEGFIYGRVITEDGDSYTGPIRWGKEEVYWTDMFNASKRRNENLEYLSDRELDRLEDRYDDDNFFSQFISISWDDDYDFVHEFSTAFGNLKTIEIRSSERVIVALKNGETLSLSGEGYNDVGARLRIIDKEIGKVTLSWRDLERIEFMPTPSRLEDRFGAPLYGTVESDIGEFTGFVQWDHDERVGDDELDGETNDDDLSIPFSKIASIEREGFSRSLVTLKSGKELELRGTNDVNDDNKGIIVTVNGLGRVDLEWSEFDKVTFKDAPDSGPSYDSFTPPSKLQGTVTVDNGDVHSGEIVYDLDEELNIEVLNGEIDDTKFIIPFSNIREITPKGYDRSEITLINGEKLMLEDAQDVGKRNQGILIKTNDDYVYVPWERVDTISFE
ncbi:MAG: hypothetical protein Tsb0034_03060 [Ekhidna sp.]